MKKFILLSIAILFFTTGCFDYIELNKIAIVSGISIDYKDDNYYVAYEILNTKNKDDNQDKEKVYVAKGKGKSITEAFYNTSLEIAKTPYLSHLKTVIISEEVAKSHVQDITDYLLRENNIRNIFRLVVATDSSAEEILENTDVNNPVVSTAIKELIENPSYANNIASTLNFEQFVVDIIDPRKDGYLSSVKIKNGDLALGPLVVFKGYEMKDYLTENESSVVNIISNATNENQFKVDCPNDEEKFIIFTTYKKPKSSIEIENKTVTISTSLEARIIENHCDYDFKDMSVYEELQKKLNSKIKSEFKSTMETLIENKTDVLKIEEAYYKKYKNDIDFTELDYKYEADVKINRNGLIFEVKE